MKDLLRKLITEIANLIQAEQNVSESENRINSYLLELTPTISKIKIGDIVKKGRFQVTRISPHLKYDRTAIEFNYFCKKILKDGVSLHKNETPLYSWDLPDGSRSVKIVDQP